MPLQSLVHRRYRADCAIRRPTVLIAITQSGNSVALCGLDISCTWSVTVPARRALKGAHGISAPPAFVAVWGSRSDGVRDAATRTEIPMKLTDTQLVLLSAASQRADGAIELAPSLGDAASHKVVHKLVSNGLIEEVAAGGLLPVWRRDEEKGALALRITSNGLAAHSAETGNCERRNLHLDLWC